jgi:hypothetical protein
MLSFVVFPWEFDTDAVHNGRTNRYTLIHKGKKITLLPLMANEIVQCDRTIAETAKRDSESQLDQTAPHSSSNAIKLKSHAMLATWSDLVVPPTVDAPFHALVCRQILFSLDDITMPFLALSQTFCMNLKIFFLPRYPRDCHL